MQRRAQAAVPPGMGAPDTFVVLDWDDTLVHTSGCDTVGGDSSALSGCASPQLDEAVLRLLRRLLAATPHVVLITNASAEWLRLSATAWVPRTAAFLGLTSRRRRPPLDIVSARDSYSGGTAREAAGLIRASDEPSQAWKVEALARWVAGVAGRAGSPTAVATATAPAPAAPLHMVSIGDADWEHEALDRVAGSPALAHRPHVSQCHVRLVEQPTTAALLLQVRALGRSSTLSWLLTPLRATGTRRVQVQQPVRGGLRWRVTCHGASPSSQLDPAWLQRADSDSSTSSAASTISTDSDSSGSSGCSGCSGCSSAAGAAAAGAGAAPPVPPWTAVEKRRHPRRPAPPPPTRLRLELEVEVLLVVAPLNPRRRREVQLGTLRFSQLPALVQAELLAQGSMVQRLEAFRPALPQGTRLLLEPEDSKAGSAVLVVPVAATAAVEVVVAAFHVALKKLEARDPRLLEAVQAVSLEATGATAAALREVPAIAAALQRLPPAAGAYNSGHRLEAAWRFHVTVDAE